LLQSTSKVVSLTAIDRQFRALIYACEVLVEGAERSPFERQQRGPFDQLKLQLRRMAGMWFVARRFSEMTIVSHYQAGIVQP